MWTEIQFFIHTYFSSILFLILWYKKYSLNILKKTGIVIINPENQGMSQGKDSFTLEFSRWGNWLDEEAAFIARQISQSENLERGLGKC